MSSLRYLILASACFGSSLQADPGQTTARTAFDRAPWVSARAAGMGQALSPIANGMEAAFYNPSLIGAQLTKAEAPMLTHLYFPYLGGSYNTSSLELQKDLTSGKNLEDPAVTEELLSAFDGEHPYARFSALPAIMISKLFVAYTYDMRAASVPDPSDPNRMLVDVRSSSGPLIGFSASTPKQDFHLGFTAASIARREVQGSFTLLEVNEASVRKANFSAVAKDYEGMPLSAGLMWKGPTAFKPSVSAVIRDAGMTKYSNREGDEFHEREDVTVGAAISPRMGSLGTFHLVLEGTQLSDKQEPARKKLRAGMELTFGDRFGSEAGLALRAGYSHAGLSGGIGINLGIIGLQAASFAEDIGVGSEVMIERRTVINFAINIADY